MTTTLRYYLTPIRVAIIKESERKYCCRYKERNLYLLLIWVQISTAITETIMRFLHKLKIYLLHDHSKLFLDIYQKSICYHRHIYGFLFTGSKEWSQPRCSSTNEWIMKMHYIYRMEEFSALKYDNINFFSKRNW